MGLFDWVRRVAGPEGTAKALLSAYSASKSARRSEEESLLAMFTTRLLWMRLPRDFLKALGQKLENYGNVYTFILFSEEHGILQNNITRVAQSGLPPSVLATTFTSLGNQLADESRAVEAESAFLLALKLDPDWFPASGSLGMLYYLGEMYREAASYFEHCLRLSKRFREQAKGVDLPSEVGCRSPNTEPFEHTFEQMYRDCLRRLS